jgi:(E)-4-hydroxy-3-methylbut-2-enyl-diphosphate synthase
LLEDGLGDTIRVSLTEDPEFELPVAKALVDRYSSNRKIPVMPPLRQHPLDPFEHRKRETIQVGNVASTHVPVVVADLSNVGTITTKALASVGYAYDEALDKWHIGDAAPDYLFVGRNVVDFNLPGTLGVIQEHDAWIDSKKERHYPILSAAAFVESKVVAERILVRVALQDLTEELEEKLYNSPNVILVLETNHENGMTEQRRLGFELVISKVSNPIILHRAYDNLNNDTLTLHASTDIGALLLDGIGNGVWLSSNNALVEDLNRLSFGILQGTRQRISKTEYISCPSCGRTLFDLQETTAKIRAVTNHLKGVKIAIMGCIVNGPGEMADADYGYVGSGVGKITLYKGKDVVKRSVPAQHAVDELIQLIRDNGDWVEPVQIPVAQVPVSSALAPR